MLRRKLIYTAITRSKQFLILCGEESAFATGVEREDDQRRKTTLFQKLQSLETNDQQDDVQGDDHSTLSAEEALFLVDPMIGMDHTTPYDFLD